MKAKDGRDTLQEEVSQLMRYACERLARSVYVKASGESIRVLALEIQQAAFKVALKEFSGESDES